MEPESVVNSLLSAVAHLDRLGGYVPPDRYGCSLSGGIDDLNMYLSKRQPVFVTMLAVHWL